MDSIEDATIITTAQPPTSHPKPDLTPTLASAFPTEIYERIIDYLDDSHNLASCCLTCRSWVPRSRLHLYPRVRISSRLHLNTFARCLKVNPNNATRVRELFISVSRDEGWVSSFPLVLGTRLKKVSQLTLTSIDVMNLHPKFYQLLSSFSSVTELSLVNISGKDSARVPLLRFIRALPCLQKVLMDSVYGVELEELDPPVQEEPPTPPAPGRPLPLRHLWLNRFRASHMVLDGLSASAASLTTLFLNFPYDQATSTHQVALRSLGKFLLSCSSLHTLWVNFDGVNGRVAHSHISFSALSDLRRLIFDLYIEKPEDITAVAELLSSMSTRSLEYLQLHLDITQEDITVTPALWEVLNESLLTPALRSVSEIAFSVRRGFTDLISEELFQLLPALRSMNVVESWTILHSEGYWRKL